MSRSKTLTLFLKDGEPSGRIKCSNKIWKGIAYKIPRTDLDKCKEDKELLDVLNGCGVYFLFGTDASNNQAVYIGQASNRKNGEGLLLRIQEPHNSIDYWTEVILFTTTDNTLGPTEISYLENRFFNIAQKAGRYRVKNSIEPNSGNISEEEKSDMDEFIDYARIVMGALGHKVFEPIAPTQKLGSDEHYLYLNYGKGKAKGLQTGEGFAVLKGSTINPGTTKSCPKWSIKDRERYADKIDENNVLTADLLFSSPSAAAGFVGGACLSGNALWKNADGKPLKDIIGEH